MKRTIKVFQNAENAIEEYRNKILSVRNMIEEYLALGKPLPQDLRYLLLDPESRDYLRNCVVVLDHVATSLVNKLGGMRGNLAQCNVIDALLVAESSKRDFFNSLTIVVGEYPYESDRLPPSYEFFRIINDETMVVFPRNLESSLETKEKRDFANYLRNVDNPWAKYATP
jgi:hypothetical protein